MNPRNDCGCGPKRVYDCVPLRMDAVHVQVRLPAGAGAPSVSTACVGTEVYDVIPADRCGCVNLTGALILTLEGCGVPSRAQVPFQVQMRAPREAPYEVAARLESASVRALTPLGGNLYDALLQLCGAFYILVTAPGCCCPPPACLPLYPPSYPGEGDCCPPPPCVPPCPPPCPAPCPPPCPAPCPPPCPAPCPPPCPAPCPAPCPPPYPNPWRRPDLGPPPPPGGTRPWRPPYRP